MRLIPRLPSDQRVMRFKDVVLKKYGAKDGIYSKSLSDGENQFMHTLGLCTLYKESNALFLLDEPETHFNPAWRSQFITRLKECLIEQKHFRCGSSRAGEPLSQFFHHEMLITTHSPFLISDSKPEHVLIFSKDNEGIDITTPDYNTFGASINKITLESFGKRETIGQQAVDFLKSMKVRYDKGENKDSLAVELENTLGESVEKLIFYNVLLKDRQ